MNAYCWIVWLILLGSFYLMCKHTFLNEIISFTTGIYKTLRELWMCIYFEFAQCFVCTS